MSRKIGLEEGWGILEEGIAKARRILEGHTDTAFTGDEYLKYYSCVYSMGVQIPDYSQQLYDRFKRTLEQCVVSLVLPSMVDKLQESLLQVLVHLWSNYSRMSKLLSSFFSYLDCFYTVSCKLPRLNSVAHSAFCNLVWPSYKDRIRDAVIALINRERQGELINRDLVRSVMVFILDAGMGITSFYEECEQAIIEDACAYYCWRASEWILDYSLADYLLKVGDCLRSEMDRLQYYFVYDSDASLKMLLQSAENRLMTLYQNQLKMQQVNGHLMLQNYQVISQELLPMCAGLTLKDKQ